MELSGGDEMPRLSVIRKALKDRISGIDGLHVYATMPASPASPAAAVIPRSRETLTFDGLARYRFAVWVYVNPSDLNRAQTMIDDYLSGEGPRSIEEAIEEDPSLGGDVDSVVVTGWSDYAQLIEIAGGTLLGARIDLEIMA